MSLKEKAFMGLVWSSLQKFGRQGISFLVFAVIARFLSADDFGQMAIISSFIVFANLFAEQGFSLAIIQKDSIDKHLIDTVFTLILIISVLLFSIIFLSSNFIASIFEKPNLSSYFKVVSLSILINPFAAVPLAILRRGLEFKKIAFRTLIATFVSGVVGILMAINGFGVWSLIGKQLTESIINAILLVWFSNWRPKLKIIRKELKYLFGFGSNILGITLLKRFRFQFLDLAIGYFIGTTVLGYYSVAVKFYNSIFYFISNTISSVIIPVYSRLQTDIDKIKGVYFSSIKIAMIVTVPTFFLLVLFSNELILLIFGEKWIQSAVILKIFGLLGILQSLQNLNEGLFISLAETYFKFKLELLNLILIVSSFLIFYKNGLTLILYTLVLISIFIISFEIIKISKLLHSNIFTYLKQIATTGLSVMFGTVTIFLLNSASEITTKFLTYSQIVLFLVIYFVVILLFEKRVIFNFINNFQSK